MIKYLLACSTSSMLSMLVFGSANTVLLKMMNLSYFIDKDGVRKQFYHAFFQTFIMFIGAFLCIGVYGIIYFRDIRKYGDYENLPQVDEAKRKGKKTRINILILFIPACFDIISSTLLILPLTMIAASIYGMMRGIIVFIAAIFSMIFLKRNYYIHHWTSLIFVVGGVAIVDASPLIFKDDEKKQENSNAVLGIALIIIHFSLKT